MRLVCVAALPAGWMHQGAVQPGVSATRRYADKAGGTAAWHHFMMLVSLSLTYVGAQHADCDCRVGMRG
jgi:hypothetical protein